MKKPFKIRLSPGGVLGRLGVACGLAWAVSAAAAEVQVAVASNFAGPFEQIAAAFEADTGHKAVVATGSTGKFYTQIRQGAPFEVLLAADDDKPRRLEAEGLAVKGQRFTYALGKLLLWSAQAGVVDEQGEVLRLGHFGHLALAKPSLAPYGQAAMDTLSALGVLAAVRDRIVQGDNIAQAYQFVATGNAELGFVAMSQVMVPGKTPVGSWWVVPAKLYTPIRQDAALLTRGAANPAAAALLAYLKGDKARAIIQAFGYGL